MVRVRLRALLVLGWKFSRDTAANKEAEGRGWQRVAVLGLMWICTGSLKTWLAAPSSDPYHTEPCA